MLIHLLFWKKSLLFPILNYLLSLYLLQLGNNKLRPHTHKWIELWDELVVESVFVALKYIK
jgi:hypothetical protein